ncbi:unnamed protein product [Linum trigynum]|uniref:Replication protein A OB domain-containing protein n=1 Tax=Linum trigynum TaxID=586398 RepID=A0AAV2E4Y3_9ROSI
MEHTLPCNLGGPRKPVVILRLRTLHLWAAKSLGDIRIYNYCSLWVDEIGVLIHGLSHASMASEIRDALHVGKIYVLRSFGINSPPNLYRACDFDLSLSISLVTSFQECSLPAENFPVDAYEFLPLAQLFTRTGDHRLLTDVIGRIHSISGVSHKITNNGTYVRQTVVIEDDSCHKATITLWDEFSGILDSVALTQADSL